ncbi:MAG TPA: KpsF/GutQ family sugar-phosphate isomerase [Ignavibacteria bacterium]|nr:KpsF/GutQ family sugar-phosphate isomerase [Ignavibacteria bacterium]
MSNRVLANAKRVIQIERKALLNIEKRLDSNFSDAVEIIFKCKGRVVVTGVGKSGIIAQKIVATLNSTGTPAIFLHSADSIHGDLGMIQPKDVVICISKSGDTIELIQMLLAIQQFNVKVISIVGDPDSKLNDLSDVIIDASIEQEACPHNLAPTTSTTAALVLGDALAIALLRKKDFTKEEFANYHPGGILGRKMLLRVNELMVRNSGIPKVKDNTLFKDLVFEISSKRLGCTCVVDKNGRLKGIITDGDIRRTLQNYDNVSDIKAKDIMNKSPKTINENMLGETALELMEKYSITQLVITDKKKVPTGVVHLHDLVKAGLG